MKQQKKYPTFKEVREKASQCGWFSIFEALAPDLKDAVDNAPRHTPCPLPGHEGSRDGFRFFDDSDTTGKGICNTCRSDTGARAIDGFELIARVNGLQTKEVLKEVALFLGFEWPGEENRTGEAHQRQSRGKERFHQKRQHREDPNSEPQINRRKARLKKISQEVVPIDHPQAGPAWRYFANRGIELREAPKGLKFHPAMEYYDWVERKVTGTWPAIVALVLDAAGKPCTYHVTYLTEGGYKAPVEIQKKVLPPLIKGGMIGGYAPLYPLEHFSTLNIVEGLETGQAVRLMTEQPVSVLLNAEMLAAFTPDSQITTLRIWGDLDRSAGGQKKAVELYNRLSMTWGGEVEIYIPSGPVPEGVKSVDWLDVYTGSRLDQVPFANRMQAVRSIAA